MRKRLCNCGDCHRCKHRQYAANYQARLRAGTVGVVGGIRKCNCGECPRCLQREKVYQRGIRLARNPLPPGPDLLESKLDAYFEQVKTRD